MPTSHAAFFRFALCLGLLTGCWEGISRRVVATVLSKQGEVVYGSSEKNDFRPLGPDEKPGVGGVLRTSDGADVDLELLPGLLVRVSHNSEFKIEELKLTKDGNETAGGMLNRAARVHLNRGKVTVYFQQPDGAEGQVGIGTDRVSFSAKPGSLFHVEANNSRIVPRPSEERFTPRKQTARVLRLTKDISRNGLQRKTKPFRLRAIRAVRATSLKR